MFKKKIAKSFTFQHDRSDCGVACLSSIIKYHNSEVPLERLRELSGTTTQGTTLLGLYQASTKIGLDAQGLEIESIDQLVTFKEPTILHVTIDERMNHFIVFYCFNPEGNLVIGDPAKGIITLSKPELENIWKSKALLKLSPNQDFAKNQEAVQRKKNWLINLAKPDATILIIILILGIILSGLNISTSIFSQKLIDNVIPEGNSKRLFHSILFLCYLLLLRSGLNYLRGVFLVSQGLEFNKRIVTNFYYTILRLPKLFFDSRKIGDLIARINDTRRIQSVISLIAGNILIDALLVIASLIAVFFYSGVIGTLVALSVPTYAVIVYILNKKILVSQKEVMAGYAATESQYIDSLQGIATIKSESREPLFESINERIYGDFQSKVYTLGKTNISFGLLSDILGVLFIVSVFGIGALLVIQKEIRLGEFVALVGLSGSSIPAVIRVSLANVQLQEAKVAFDRMFEFTELATEDSGSHKVTDQEMLDSIGAHGINLKIENVTFGFPGRSTILRNICLAASSGERVAIIGESGGGKSTLIQILQKFYNPESGRIFINEFPLADISTNDWRQLISVIPQDIKIFNGNLLFNITLSEDKTKFKEAINFCHKTGFEKYFDRLPQGYATMLGEEGLNISGGQRQLIGFARALFSNPRLLLLDESTSALDKTAENFILSLINQRKSNFTVVMVTHRPKLAAFCDKIFLLENGILKESTKDFHISNFD